MFENVFSRRKGYTPPPVQGKLEELASSARTRLWNIFYRHVFRPNFQSGIMYGTKDSLTPPADYLFRLLWTDFLRRPADEYPGFVEVFDILKARFLDGDWHCAFDIFEMVFEFRNYPLADSKAVALLIKAALEAENTAYTFLDGLFVERMTPQEVESVEIALQTPIEGVRVHLTSALQKLNDRDAPDFRNSIKEAISAVEAACKERTGLEKATLGQALKALHDKRPLHQNLKDALQQLYSWTSDYGGIRHAIKDTENVERADAQFMLVACSAFVNYLMTR
jgi:hypothetical protein